MDFNKDFYDEINDLLTTEKFQEAFDLVMSYCESNLMDQDQDEVFYHFIKQITIASDENDIVKKNKYYLAIVLFIITNGSVFNKHNARNTAKLFNFLKDNYNKTITGKEVIEIIRSWES